MSGESLPWLPDPHRTFHPGRRSYAQATVRYPSSVHTRLASDPGRDPLGGRRHGGWPIPVVTGPIPANVPPGDASHDYPQLATSLDLARPLDLASLGYVEEEYFFSGTANVYNTPTLATGTIASSGHPYKSRIIVRRPTSPARFNGTVLVEWVNVTSGYNNDTLVRQSQDHLVRAGFAYVGVSAQRVGVQVPPGGLTAWSPTRYGTLDVTDNGTITDDSLSYDIFSQAAHGPAACIWLQLACLGGGRYRSLQARDR